MFDLEAGKERDIVAIALDALDVVRHDNAHESSSLIGNIVRIDQDLTDVRRKIIADRTNNKTRFEVDQNRSRIVFGGAIDRSPKLHQIGHVPLQFFGIATNTGRASDDAHAGRDGQLVHGFAQFLTFFALDAARNTAASRVVRHQDQVTTR